MTNKLKKEKATKIIKYRKQKHINVGLIFFVIIFLYLCLYSIHYFRKDKISLYEVVDGSVTQNNSFSALAIRKEEVYYANSEGYINYFISEGAKVSPKSLIYSLDQNGDFHQALLANADKKIIFKEENKQELNEMLVAFRKSYHQQQFNKIYQFKDDVQSKLIQLLTFQTNSNNPDIPLATTVGVLPIYGQSTGVIVYGVDQMETLTVNSLTKELLDEALYTKINLKRKEKIALNEPVYKLITDDNWELVFTIDDSLYQSIKDETYLQIRFQKDGQEAWGKCSFTSLDNQKLLVLSLNNSMPRYAENRFLEVELFVDNIQGLKVANSSIIKKEFYLVPEEYITNGGNSDHPGLLVEHVDKNGKVEMEFVQTTLYKKVNGFYYISCLEFTEESIIVNIEENLKMTLSQKASLKGVYNMNKGYAVFRLVDILYKSKDYSILSTDTNYGISMYDHIALEGNKVTEGQFSH